MTSIAECDNIFIIGDSNGYISFFKKENSKFVPSHNIKLKSKIEDFILIDARKILIVLSGGKLFIYDIINYADYSPKNTSELKLNDKNLAALSRGEKREAYIKCYMFSPQSG